MGIGLLACCVLESVEVSITQALKLTLFYQLCRERRFTSFDVCLVRHFVLFVGAKIGNFGKQWRRIGKNCIFAARNLDTNMENTAETRTSSGYSQVQIHALKDSLKASIDKESNIELLRECALLLSLDKDMYDLSRAIPMNDLLSMVKEDIHTMFQNTAQ